MQQPMLAFEVDHVDDGHAPTPWAAGIHNVWLQIVPHTVTGRRLGAERLSW
ncbi:MAG: hypothetical protein ACLPLP_26820 [Mycobacterium sp.]